MRPAGIQTHGGQGEEAAGLSDLERLGELDTGFKQACKCGDAALWMPDSRSTGTPTDPVRVFTGSAHLNAVLERAVAMPRVVHPDG